MARTYDVRTRSFREGSAVAEARARSGVTGSVGELSERREDTEVRTFDVRTGTWKRGSAVAEAREGAGGELAGAGSIASGAIKATVVERIPGGFRARNPFTGQFEFISAEEYAKGEAGKLYFNPPQKAKAQEEPKPEEGMTVVTIKSTTVPSTVKSKTVASGKTRDDAFRIVAKGETPIGRDTFKRIAGGTISKKPELINKKYLAELTSYKEKGQLYSPKDLVGATKESLFGGAIAAKETFIKVSEEYRKKPGVFFTPELPGGKIRYLGGSILVPLGAAKETFLKSTEEKIIGKEKESELFQLRALRQSFRVAQEGALLGAPFGAGVAASFSVRGLALFCVGNFPATQ